MTKSNKRKPANDPGYFISVPCECGGKIRTWILPTARDYYLINDDAVPETEIFRFGDRVAKCFSCWNDKTGMVAELIARGGNLK